MVLSMISLNLSTWRADWSLTHKTPEAPVVIAKTASNNILKTLPNGHLFGNADNPLGHMPISSLQFRVIGIAKVSDQPEHSKAYISVAGNSGKIFRIGDLLPYGVRVYDITNDTVILENNGQLEKLPIPRDSLVFKSKTNIQEQV
jgi:hypothetical protein